MMEQKQMGEQPKTFDNVQVTEVKEENNEIDNQGTSLSNQEGSPYGKFKDSESLLSAYNNLQAEFTRKCQKLSDLEKEKENSEKKSNQKIFEDDNWQNKVSSFLATHKDAKKFASEISQEILTNPSLQNQENALDIAWANVVSKNYKSPDDVINDDKFINDFVLSNEQIQKKVLSKYIEERESNKVPPILTSSQGGEIAFKTQKQATNLEEARQMVEAILNIKGE